VWGLLLTTAVMWMEHQTSELWCRCSKYWVSDLVTMFLHILAYFCSVGWWRTKFQMPNFLFYGNILKDNRMYQQLKICKEKVCPIYLFWGKFGQTILCTPKICVLLHLCIWLLVFLSAFSQRDKMNFARILLFFIVCNTQERYWNSINYKK